MSKQDKEKQIATFKEQLAPFLKQNPNSEVRKWRKEYAVMNPWNDDSLCFALVPDSASDLIEALNNLILPPRFTALYHLDTNTMEYIFTVLEKDSSYASRKFEFVLDSKSYLCKFDDASQRLLVLSKLFRIVKPESYVTEYRNLLLLRDYVRDYIDLTVRKRALVGDWLAEIKPISFYVSGFEGFDESRIVEVSKHLNFFMQYYDRSSPIVLMHSIEPESAETIRRPQLIEITFPERISTRRQDPFLLDLALVAMDVETRLRFLYYYQILEYAASYYIDDEVRRSLSRIMSAPDIHSNLDRYVPSILDAVAEIRQTDETKLNKIVENRCSPNIVWSELQKNVKYFSERHEFDGGFVVEPIITEDMTPETFATIYTKIPETLRKIRNALVHGREKRYVQIISPSTRNDRLTRPWINIARCVAEQVIICSRVT